MKLKDKQAHISVANDLAVNALVFLAEDEDRLGRFLAISGIDPRTIREAAREPGFLVGVLDHLMSDEDLLLSFASTHGIRPQDVPQARAVLAGPVLQ